jgi:NAD(P)-dependent dehydrogenase (short-subunit alcohol dehydrogenase family)
MTCRNADKGARVIAELSESIGVRAHLLQEKRADLVSMASLRELLGELACPLDLVFLNAGIFNLPFVLTPEGHERTYAVNYLGHFLLVHGLLSRGLLAPNARIVATSSEGLKSPFARADLSLLTAPEPARYSRLWSSPSSKVLLALMGVELTRRVQESGPSGVTMNGVCPPGTLTDNVNQGGALSRALARAVAPLVMTDVGHGAAVLLWAATAPELAGQSGKLFSHKLREMRLPPRATDPELAAQAWRASERALGLLPWPRAR